MKESGDSVLDPISEHIKGEMTGADPEVCSKGPESKITIQISVNFRPSAAVSGAASWNHVRVIGIVVGDPEPQR